MDGQAATRGHAGMMNNSQQQKPFTGGRMLLWLGGFFAVIFAANAVFIWLAFDSWTGLEVESAYKAGQGYQQEIDSARAQTDRGWSLEARVERTADGHAAVNVAAHDKAGGPLTGLPLSATLHRPTQSAEDRVVPLREGEAGRYSGVVENLPAGQWDLILEARNDETLVYRSRNRIFLAR